MKWNPTETQQPHVSYITAGFGLVVLGAISHVLRERIYLGEVPFATIYGLIIGPHCLNWVDPTTWGNFEYITIEITRFVLLNEVFSVGLELPPKYFKKQAWTMVTLLGPVMTIGWLVSSAFIWKLVPGLRWIDGLAIAGCITATDPVLSAVIVGKGSFGESIGEPLRDMLSAESAINDGMALPFVYIALNIIQYEYDPGEIALHVICITFLYTCVLSAFVGAVIGFCARHILRFAMSKDLVVYECALIFYFCTIIFCGGVSTVCGLDDLLLVVAAGSAFSWDGWFPKAFPNFHVADILTSFFNVLYFIYFGCIVPWDQFNSDILPVWRLICLGIIIMIVRRIPALLVTKPLISELKTWKDALIAGHFGPIGVCALFMALMMKSELSRNSPVPAEETTVPMDPTTKFTVEVVWPITCFLVLTCIVIHGGSVPLYKLVSMIYRKAQAQFGHHPEHQLPVTANHSEPKSSNSSQSSELAGI